jgi:NTE family protein
MSGLRRSASLLRRQWASEGPGAPGLASVMVNAFNITQDRIMRSRLAGDPPDALISLKVGKIGLFEFHRAEELIALGRDAVRKARDEIAEQLELALPPPKP